MSFLKILGIYVQKLYKQVLLFKYSIIFMDTDVLCLL